MALTTLGRVEEKPRLSVFGVLVFIFFIVLILIIIYLLVPTSFRTLQIITTRIIG